MVTVTYLTSFNLHFADEQTCQGLSSGAPVCISSPPGLREGQAGCLQWALVGVFTPQALAHVADQGFPPSESRLVSIHRHITAPKLFDWCCLLK